jgi:hypothetical protein
MAANVTVTAAPDLKIHAKATSIIAQRRRDEQAQEYEQVTKELNELEEQEDKKLREREARGEAGITTYIAGLTAKVTVEFHGTRFVIDMARRDGAERDISIAAMGRLALFVTRQIQSEVQAAENAAKTGIAVPTTPAAGWVERLLDHSGWLGPAYRRGLVTVTKATKRAR